jgi:hypothetical protein
VADHLVAVAATAARPLAELGGGRRRDAVERGPGRLDETSQPVASAGETRRRSRSVIADGTPKSVPLPPPVRSTTS